MKCKHNLIGSCSTAKPIPIAKHFMKWCVNCLRPLGPLGEANMHGCTGISSGRCTHWPCPLSLLQPPNGITLPSCALSISKTVRNTNSTKVTPYQCLRHLDDDVWRSKTSQCWRTQQWQLGTGMQCHHAVSWTASHTCFG